MDSDSNDFIKLVAALHRDVLILLNSAAGRHHQGCAMAAKALGLRGKLGRRIRELDTVKGWAGKLSAVSSKQFVLEVRTALANGCIIEKSLHDDTRPQEPPGVHLQCSDGIGSPLCSGPPAELAKSNESFDEDTTADTPAPPSCFKLMQASLKECTDNLQALVLRVGSVESQLARTLNEQHGKQIVDFCTTKIEEIATNFHGMIVPEVIKVTSGNLDMLMARFQEISDRIDALAVSATTPTAVQPACLDSHCSASRQSGPAGPPAVGAAPGPGHCDQGTMPDFASRLAELTPHQTRATGECENWEEIEKIIERSMTPCQYFLQGNCKFGDRCAFSHAGERPRAATPPLVVDCDWLQVGDRVEIHGLTKSSHLNGRHGRIGSYVASFERYEVVLDGDPDSKAIKGTNIRKFTSWGVR
eukprot:TRINITY_DN18398_c0_g1_i1.p1 TRINITY_DN18398_c0_g1~~TRINITY_DN18398_c0_g1_i1.p1  ORF type:complete len:416 (+),score=65.09 TRINITY_DN18398_c0_g1_i1:73-1320(+)